MMSKMNNSFSKPRLVWVIEPENKIRFRYESEGGSHGGLAGKLGKKTYPTLELQNYHGRKQVFVRVSLYTEDGKEHVLEFKGKKSKDSKRYVEEKLQDDNRVEFKNLQIISKKKDEIEKILMERRLNNLKDDMCSAARAQFEKKYKKDVKERARAILNSVRLHFEAFEDDRPCVPLCKLISDEICNQKAAAKGDLRICRLSQVAGSCKGGEEVILLCEKVQKESIKVKFYEMDEQGIIIWQDYGSFSPADVWYQVAIPFKTPPYKEQNVEKKVFICLERNGEVSEPREFTYKCEESSRKKRKLVHIRSEEKNICQSETILSSGNPESSDNSASSMSISSPASSNNVEIPSVSNSASDDIDSLDMGELFDENDLNFCFKFLNDVAEPEDYNLPFDVIKESQKDDFNDELDTSYLPEIKEQIWNQRVECDGTFKFQPAAEMLASAQMYVSKVLDGEMDISSGPVGQMYAPATKYMEMNQNLDLVDLDVGLRDFTLKDKSEKEFKNCYLNKFFQNGSKSSNSSDSPLLRKKQFFSSILLKRDKIGNTLLHIAVLENKNIVSVLNMCHIAKIDLINVRNCKNKTALHLASERNRIKAIKILLQNSGNPNLKDCNGNNCYHIAAKNNLSSVLEEINKFSHFSHNVCDFNDEGLTPVHIAIMQNDSEHLFELLKIHMTNPNLLEKKAGKSLLHYAVDFQPSILSKLLKMADIDVDNQDFAGNTPLHIACAIGNIEAVKQLLQSGADPLIKNFKQSSNSLDPENSDDDISDGQLPADVTTNIEILKLLRVAAKTEDEDLLNFQNSDSYEGSDELPCLIMEKLCRHLDEDMKWKKLVVYCFDEDVIDSLTLSSSPTKALLDYIKKQEKHGYIEKLKQILEIAELRDAVNIMNIL